MLILDSGIVAAETVLEIASEQPLTTAPSGADDQDDENDTAQTFMFPYIQGVLAFDTPYLGISPGVIAHGAEGHYKTASTTLTQLSGLVGGFWGGKAGAAAASDGGQNRRQGKDEEPKAILPPPAADSTNTASAASAAAAAASAAAQAPDSSPANTNNSGGVSQPAWNRWGKVAMYASAAGAVAAGAAGAAYLKREQLTEGWSWASSHLEFVGCLMRGEELKTRLARLVELRSRGLGFADLYTVLGKSANAGPHGGGGPSALGAGSGVPKGSYGALIAGPERTFCSLPKTEKLKAFFVPTVNDAATDETGAHMGEFFLSPFPQFFLKSSVFPTFSPSNAFISNPCPHDHPLSRPPPQPLASPILVFSILLLLLLLLLIPPFPRPSTSANSTATTEP